jgi:hypothetical protein
MIRYVPAVELDAFLQNNRLEQLNRPLLLWIRFSWIVI